MTGRMEVYKAFWEYEFELRNFQRSVGLAFSYSFCCMKKCKKCLKPEIWKVLRLYSTLRMQFRALSAAVSSFRAFAPLIALFVRFAECFDSSRVLRHYQVAHGQSFFADFTPRSWWLCATIPRRVHEILNFALSILVHEECLRCYCYMAR
jgi:hypothetical protein